MTQLSTLIDTKSDGIILFPDEGKYKHSLDYDTIIIFWITGRVIFMAAKPKSKPAWRIDLKIKEEEVPIIESIKSDLTYFTPILEKYPVPFVINWKQIKYEDSVSKTHKIITYETILIELIINIQQDDDEYLTHLVKWTANYELADLEQLISDINARINPLYPRILAPDGTCATDPDGYQ